MINIAICDDDLPATSEMEDLISRFFEGTSMRFQASSFFDGQGLWDSIRKGDGYDIIFLDIEMAGMDGITVARKIRERSIQSIIIYVSGHPSYCPALFEVETFRFIGKPIDPGQFWEILSKAVERCLACSQVYSFRFRRAFHAIPIHEISYFESSRHMVAIHTENGGPFYQQKKLSEIESSLKNASPPFLRIHQSFLVNLQHIKKMSYSKVTLDDGTELGISEKRRKSIRQQYFQMMERL